MARPGCATRRNSPDRKTSARSAGRCPRHHHVLDQLHYRQAERRRSQVSRASLTAVGEATDRNSVILSYAVLGSWS